METDNKIILSKKKKKSTYENLKNNNLQIHQEEHILEFLIAIKSCYISEQMPYHSRRYR